MKKTIVLLAVAGLLGSIARADSFDVKTASAPVKKAVAKRPHQVTYITNVPVTGSHLPLVVTRYGNSLHANSSLAVYGQPQLDQTGQLNVGAEISQREPAISSASVGRR